MTRVEFSSPDKYIEAYWYCRLYLKTWEWTEDFTIGYTLKFLNKETAMEVVLKFT